MAVWHSGNIVVTCNRVEFVFGGSISGVCSIPVKVYRCVIGKEHCIAKYWLVPGKDLIVIDISKGAYFPIKLNACNLFQPLKCE